MLLILGHLPEKAGGPSKRTFFAVRATRMKTLFTLDKLLRIALFMH
ncbi:hypothetical protein PAMC26510_23820 [Caballeronia sordidicola]|uniref:Uncharacterized protein n=1 Tax=Caballeronia sordidicola TaxID=196367 RepID=A0A242N471_CABSO|nr:hypothetical protein PAMC26510_23820 [Caballeronia sordidicola]OTP78174.1 hypothetical protein PAMC26577_05945 [Caballeronia sordidicola]